MPAILVHNKHFTVETYPSTDLLADFEINLQQASHGKRFANYLIDTIIYVIVLSFGYAAFLLMTHSLDDNTDTSILTNILLSLVLGLMYGLVEGVTKGKSLGKLITGTRVVNTDGSDISFKTAVLRGLSRLVPFEPFSALSSPSYPWHDKWTNTYVIDERQSTRRPN